MSIDVHLSHGPIDPVQLLGQFSGSLEGEGAVVSFSGHARRTAADGAALQSLVLESYRGATLRSMQAIAADATSRFGIERAIVVHRAGRIAPGEVIVFVAAASAHRRAAFEAADYLMDRLKTEAVFWKREETALGSRWIEPVEADHVDAARWTRSDEQGR